MQNVIKEGLEKARELLFNPVPLDDADRHLYGCELLDIRKAFDKEGVAGVFDAYVETHWPQWSVYKAKSWNFSDTHFEEMRGRTAVKVENTGDEIIFRFENGDGYMLHHLQDCCEDVRVEDVVGDLDDLVGAPLMMAEEIESPSPEWEDTYDPGYGDHQWTFYKFATIKGYVTVRFLGTSNGYYSTSVYLGRCS
jgi:hypothetical protein